MYAVSIVFLVLAIFGNVTGASYCSNITNIFLPQEKYVSCNGNIKDIILFWGSDTSRAASGLLAAFLRHRLGYKKVQLQEAPHSLQVLAANVTHDKSGNYKEVILAISTSWEPTPPPVWVPNTGSTSGLAGPRLIELGASQIPVREYLHLYLPKEFNSIKLCVYANTWNFYKNLTTLNHCGFINQPFSDDNMKKAVVYKLDRNNNKIMSELKDRAHASQLYLRFEKINRTNLFGLLKKSKNSFLFLDYDIWSEYSNIRMVQLPPCIPNDGNSPCKQELDTAISMRVADVATLESYAKRILQVTQIFEPTPNSLRSILELEDINHNIEEAACQWVLKNETELQLWNQTFNITKQVYEILVMWHPDETNFNNYDILFKYLVNYISHNQLKIFDAVLWLRKYHGNYSNINELKNLIGHYMDTTIKQRLLGVVVNTKSITKVANIVDGSTVPIIFYGAPSIKANLTESIWLSTGNSFHLIHALHHFMQDMDWRRIAILSETTPIAQNFIDDLTEYLRTVTEQNQIEQKKKGFEFRNHLVESKISQTEAHKLLQNLKSIEDARIILINTNHIDTLTILEAANKLNMNNSNYVWISLDWSPNNLTIRSDIRLLTVSFWYRNNNIVPDTEGNKHIRDVMDNNSMHGQWPAKGTALVDAILTLVEGYKEVFLKYPQTQYDIRSKFAMREFEKSLNGMTIIGTNHNLTYKGHSLEETMVLIEEWNGKRSELLARYRVNATAFTVHVEYQQHDKYIKYTAVKDGTKRCLTISSGDKYLPNCQDVVIAVSLIFAVLALPTLVIIFRALQRYEKKRVEKLMEELIIQRKQCAAIVSNHLVQRSALIMHHEIGSGRFGCVRLAELKILGRLKQVVAAKCLRDNVDEKEIVHEAYILGSLEHDHIVRLIGVCIDDKPTVLLMEYALFGDLLNYLQDRWYLAEGAATELMTNVSSMNKEAVHVSPRALTRLGRQAASALAYLCQQGYVHRDVRASNCLIDANRSLKLADFGLARKITVSGAEASAGYTAIRERLLPVVWMAPESLKHGVFSTASDVWALGLLIFELVTLGGRPYGEASPSSVWRYVVSGGKPSMPEDASPQAIALARLCWKRRPEQRPTAAEVVAYLAERPYALCPAFKYCHNILDNHDSGFSESPTHTLLQSASTYERSLS